jgi:protoheme IX farnesyltransferase
MPKTLFASYLELTKPRIASMVLVTTVLGFALGAGNSLQPYDLLVFTLIGTALSGGGASVLNHYIERNVDAKMERTKNRPLPSGTIKPTVALLYGIVMTSAGSIFLYLFVNPLTAALAFTSAVLYLLVYTPLKRFSWINTPVGAIPGAIPPLIGWAAAAGELGVGAWVLFAILFLWQHPHFYAIAWMYREDYQRGGFKMLPVVHPDGKSTFRQSLAAAIILVPVSLWPTFVQMSGWLYFFGALLFGFWFLWACIRWRMSESNGDARKVLRVSIIYLPAILLLILVDSFVHAIPPMN